MKKNDLKKTIRTIPDFPKPGILFRDITTLLKNHEAFKKAIDLLARQYRQERIDTFGGVQTPPFRAGKGHAALSINPEQTPRFSAGCRRIDYVVAVEARGFILGGALAYKLGAGFIPVRKKGKLPAKTQSVTYSLEYGADTLELHEDAIEAGARVLIVDDLLATGGTAKAVTELVKKMNAEIVGVVFLIELTDLKGREKLKDFNLASIIKFRESEK